MGKDLKGKELGEGLQQLKTGKYLARVCYRGIRASKSFSNLQEAKIWVAQRQIDSSVVVNESITLDRWFEYWITEIKQPTIRDSTYETYRRAYGHINIGSMKLCDIKPLHCQQVLNDCAKHHKSATVKLVMVLMKQIFKSAVDNELLVRSPARNVKIAPEPKEERRVLTREEQKKLTEYITLKQSKYKDEYLLILETGLRIGEVMGLKWSDIDFKERKIYVRRQMVYLHGKKTFEEHLPKSEAGKRMIPMTNRAYQILKSRKVTRIDYVFFEPNRKRLTMNICLTSICKAIGIDKVTVHGLRHTFATRCIEAGMKPKTLQKILGHGDITLTMNLYVHTTESTLFEEMEKLNVVMNW